MKNFKVAGVTFNNENGVNRQGILAELVAAKRDIIGCLVKKTTYEGELALSVTEKTTGLQIGFIQKSMIPEALKANLGEVTGFIKFNKKGKCFYVELQPMMPPTKSQYIFVARHCNNDVTKMPAYDVRAYKRWFAMNTAETKKAAK